MVERDQLGDDERISIEALQARAPEPALLDRPRVPLGGGAIYGKHPTHVERFGARVARELAIEAVKRAAGECPVRAVYWPNVAEPQTITQAIEAYLEARGAIQDAPRVGNPAQRQRSGSS